MPLKENSATKRKETNTLKERKLESQPASLWKRNVLETRPPLYDDDVLHKHTYNCSTFKIFLSLFRMRLKFEFIQKINLFFLLQS